MNVTKWLSLVLIIAMLIGPLASIAGSQTSQPARDSSQESSAPAVAAGLSNVFYVPGKALVCTGGVVLGVLVMLVTFGTAYDETTRFAKGACAGRWALSAADMKPAVQGAPAP